jgi:hypothetical protein
MHGGDSIKMKRTGARAASDALTLLATAAAAMVPKDGDGRAAEELRVCLAVARLLHPELGEDAWEWVARHVDGVAPTGLVGDGSRVALAAVVRSQPSGEIDPLATFYERFLQQLDRAERKRRGVFYTPPALVRYVLRSVDQSLREEFGFRAGLLDDTTWSQAVERGLVERVPEGMLANAPLVRIIDPALGAGLFLTELLWLVRRQVADDDEWNDVAPGLLARLGGVEILPAAAAIAIVRVAATLAATGYRFESDARIDVRVGDALAAPLRPAWTVVVGNPPFSGISSAKHAWLEGLLHGRGPHGEVRADYFEVDGRPLAERKHWLQDDYVKFLRIAHEQIETVELGIVGLVTNHGYLDNTTFRGLRQKLANTFPWMSFVDLHGNAKRRERTPDNERDENVFAIEQGVAICLLRRPPGKSSVHHERADLWGTRAAKLAALEGPLTFAPFSTGVQGHAFHVSAGDSYPEYDVGWSIDEAMPINSTAPVTARDRFVVAHTLDQLAARCHDFCDASLSDDVIRARYFTRTRSRSYPAGDTRGWQLSAARRRMQSLDWRSLVRRVQYRPLDWRVMLWADWLIDWPRTEVTSHLLCDDNVALITRRQAPPGQPWTFAWITDGLALDGIIRSDNRGSESLFPLWLGHGEERRPNFAPAFLQAMSASIGVDCPPLTVFCYVYALLHAKAYRERYQSQLAGSFPRVLIPREAQLFQSMATIGARLIETHLLRCTNVAQRYRRATPTNVAAGYPRLVQRRLHLNAADYFARVPPQAMSFQVGSHRPCHKLLKDRRGRELRDEDIAQLGRAIVAVRQTLALQRYLDARILANVDFAQAFAQ